MPIDLDALFTYHRPTPSQGERYDKLRKAHGDLARLIQELTPASAEETLAIRALHVSSMQANAAIACNEPDADAERVDG